MLFQTAGQTMTYVVNWISLIIIIILVVSILVFIKIERHNTGKKVFLMLSMALCQTLFFGLTVFLLERINLVWMKVVIYDNVFLSAELGLVFYLFFLLIDFIVEFFRYFVEKIIKEPSDIQARRIAIFIVSLLQTVLFIIFNYALSQANIFGIYLFDGMDNPINPILFFLYFLGLIFLSEVVIEYTRMKLNLEETST